MVDHADEYAVDDVLTSMSAPITSKINSVLLTLLLLLVGGGSTMLIRELDANTKKIDGVQVKLDSANTEQKESQKELRSVMLPKAETLLQLEELRKQNEDRKQTATTHDAQLIDIRLRVARLELQVDDILKRKP